jgi:hypothetical protein
LSSMHKARVHSAGRAKFFGAYKGAASVRQ